MDEVRTIEEYIAAVRDALADVSPGPREDALAELEQLLREEAARNGERAAIEAVGWPHAYARDIRSALAGEPVDGPVPQGRLLGLPYDFRGVSTERLSERLWNPADPRVFMPRLFGVGWTINFGAIAVKLGLIRPDDAGDEAFARIPDFAVRIALIVPALLTAATLALVATSWSSLPAEVPVHWNATGVPDDWAAKPLALGLLLCLAVLPVIATYATVLRRGTGIRTRVFSAAALGLLSLLGLGIAIATIADADGGRAGAWIWLAIVGGLVLSFLMLYVPARLGMRAEWRETIGRSNEGDS